MKRPLSRQIFEAAKNKCGLRDATFFNGGFGMKLAPFRNSPTSEQRRTLKCMDAELSEFDYRVIIESPPPE